MTQAELLKQLLRLTESQREKIAKEIADYVSMNDKLKSTRPVVCPCCNKQARFIKRGFTKNHKKQIYQCKECYHKFVYDSHTVTSQIKISESEFVEICTDTLMMVPIKETATKLRRSRKCVFLNRHKFLSLLESYLNKEKIELDGTIEFDETYILESHKGKASLNRKARHRGGHSKLRGISHEQVCVVTSTDRNAHEIFKAVGYAKPTSKIINDTFGKHIIEKSVLYTDGLSSYDELAKERNCTIKHLKGYETYNKVEHLNTVNCIHSIIKNAIRQYRGIATKYINRYASLFVFYRRYQESNQHEIVEHVIKLFKFFFHTVRRDTINNYEIFA